MSDHPRNIDEHHHRTSLKHLFHRLNERRQAKREGEEARQKRLAGNSLIPPDRSQGVVAQAGNLPEQSEEHTAKYRTVKMLGKGSYGEVYLVERLLDGRLLAMKEIEFHARDKESLKRVNDEITILRQFDHPHIVAYEDSEVPQDGFNHEGKGKAILYMEYCEMEDLYTYVERQMNRDLRERVELAGLDPALPLPEQSVGETNIPQTFVWQFLMQISSALAVCHHGIRDEARIPMAEFVPVAEKPTIHRDLKPNNIFLVPRRDPQLLDFKLGDFGLAVTGAGPRRTQLRGDYVAPEISLDGRKRIWTPQCDIYSLSCVAYFMCTGRDPDALWDLEPMLLIGEMTASYPRELCALITNCCRKAPADRPNACQIYHIARDPERLSNAAYQNILTIREDRAERMINST